MVGEKRILFLLLSTLLITGFKANAFSYDSTASAECLTKPHNPQYKGGIIQNPEMNNGLNGWTSFGDAKIVQRESEGNQFIVAHSRIQPHDSLSQNLYLNNNKLYSFSAWVQVNEGSNVPVTAVFKTRSGFKHAGAVVAQSKCWSMLKGGLTVDESGSVSLYFESNNTSVEIWVDSVSLQPFTQNQWRTHQDQIIEKVRKSLVKVKAVDAQGNPLSNATITIKQKRAGFPLGCAMNKNILSNTAYQNWFTSRFKVTTFEDEMKWYSTEPSQGHEDYSVADAMLRLAKQHNIAVRGHNVFWDDENYQPGWIKSLSKTQLNSAAFTRLNSIMARYKGLVIGWDVVNENLHHNFFESRVGSDASPIFYNWATKADGATTLFMNEFNTIEQSSDGKSTPAKYIAMLNKIKSYPGNQNIKLGIGLEAHFTSPINIPYMRSAIDSLSSTGFPIWLTEVDLQGSSPSQANDLEQILREAYSHPSVNGIVIWGAWKPGGCYRMCLTDNNFKNLPTGDVVDKLLREWGSNRRYTVTTDANGYFEASLFHGDYDLQISHPAVTNSSFTTSFNVSPLAAAAGTTHQTPLLLHVDAF